MRRNQTIKYITLSLIILTVLQLGSVAKINSFKTKFREQNITHITEMKQQKATDAAYIKTVEDQKQELQKQLDNEIAKRTQLEQRASRGKTGPRIALSGTANIGKQVLNTGDLRSDVLYCIRSYEGWYTSVSKNGLYMGAYQWDASTWAGNITRLGHPELAKTPPNQIDSGMQDDAAWLLYNERGLKPWPTPNRWCQPGNIRPKRMP